MRIVSPMLAPALAMLGAITPVVLVPCAAQQPAEKQDVIIAVPPGAGRVIQERIIIKRDGPEADSPRLEVSDKLKRVEVERAATFDFVSSEMDLPGKVIKGAPYSAEAVTERTQVLADGNRIVHRTTSPVFRDSEGRTRRENKIETIGPWSTSGEAVQVVFIHDPVQNVSYTLNVNDKTVRKMNGRGMVVTFDREPGPKEAGEVTTFSAQRVPGPGAAAEMFHMRVGKSGAGNPSANTKTESLGTRMIDGVKAEGTRVVDVIPAGEIGNERPIEIVFERWYSPELQTTLSTRHTDPRTGETVYKLANLRREEPVRSLFEIPAEYTEIPVERPREFRRTK
ncbi:MAG TPA: hypothetical protein VEQ63_08820 [Bryobacteraceae bacterium]|nr:hypothetical protein [Bryobacteraceae bacterium]